MANETTVRLSADSTGYVAEIGKARKASNDFMASQTDMARRTELAQNAMAEAAKSGSTASSRAIKSFTDSLDKAAATAGKTRAQILEMRAANLGLGDSVKPLIDQIAKASQNTHEFGLHTAGAKRELLVLAHEASQDQWKNFGGSLLVMGERMNAMEIILSPLGIGLGALAAATYVVGSAIHSMNEEAKELNRTMVLTSNYANLSQGALLVYSDVISHDLGVSTADARDSLKAMAATGFVAGADLKEVAESISAYAKFTGESVADVSKQFAASYGSAGKAAEHWAETHHDLSNAQVEYIKTLEQSGDNAGAWRQYVLDASSKARSAVVADNHAMAISYESLGDAWRRFWRTVGGATGKGDDELTQITDRISALRAQQLSPDNIGGAANPAMDAEIKQLEARRTAILDGKRAVDEHTKSVALFDDLTRQHTEDMKKAWGWQEKLNDANKTAKDRTDALIKSAQAAGTLTPALQAKLQSDLQKQLAFNAEQFKAPKDHTKAYTDDAATRFIQQAKETQAALQAQLETTAKMGPEAEKLVKFEQQIADLKEKKTLTAEQKSLLAAADQIEAVLKQNVALERQNKLKEEQAKLDQRIASIDAQVANFQSSQREQYGRQLEAVGMGQEAQKRAEAVKSIYREYERLQAKLEEGTPVELRGGDQYRDEQAKLRSALDESLKDYEDYYSQLKAKQGDWTNGVSQGFANYMDTASNTMKQVESLFGTVTSGMEDAWTTFTQTGKVSFTSLANSIIADLSRMAAKAAMSGLFGNLASIGGSLLGTFFGSNTGAAATAANALPGDSLDNFLSLTDNFAAKADGGLISGPGSGTSDSIPAWLSNGEFVMKASAVSRLGLPLLNQLNNGATVNRMSRFADGGAVGRTVSDTGRGNSTQVSVNVQAGTGAGGFDKQDASWLEKAVKSLVDQRMSQKMRGQGGYAYQLKYGQIL